MTTQEAATASPRTALRTPGERNGIGFGRRPPRASAEAVRVRRVHRVVRHLDLWSVFRVAALLNASLLISAMVAGVGLWLAATSVGAVSSVEHFVASTLLLKNFRFQSFPILTGMVGLGVAGVVLATAWEVLMAAFYNLVSDMVGGVELTVIEEEPARPRV